MMFCLGFFLCLVLFKNIKGVIGITDHIVSFTGCKVIFDE